MQVLESRETCPLGGIAEVQSVHGNSVAGPTRPRIQRTLEAGVSHLNSLMEIYRWQSEHGRWFLHEDHRHIWSENTKAFQTLESVQGVQVTTTNRFGKFMTTWSPVAEELAASVKDHEVSSVAFVVEEVTGAVDAVEARPTAGGGGPSSETCARRWTSLQRESTGLPMDPKMVAKLSRELLSRVHCKSTMKFLGAALTSLG